MYVRLDNPVELRRRAGKRLNSRAAWDGWREQMLDMRYAAEAGFVGVDLDAFFTQSVEELEGLPFRSSYVAELCTTISALALSMSFYNTIAYRDMAYKEAAHRLSAYAIRLLKWIQETKPQNLDWEPVSELASSAYKGLGLSYNHDRSFGVLVRRVLDSQLADGSWNTDPLPEQNARLPGGLPSHDVPRYMDERGRLASDAL